jgi:hypothetical protein
MKESDFISCTHASIDCSFQCKTISQEPAAAAPENVAQKSVGKTSLITRMLSIVSAKIDAIQAQPEREGKDLGVPLQPPPAAPSAQIINPLGSGLR